MTIYAGARCPVQSCPFNLGERGVLCAWLTGRSHRCHHSKWHGLWAQLTEAQEALAVEAPAHAGEMLATMDKAPAGRPATFMENRLHDVTDFQDKVSTYEDLGIEKIQAEIPARSLASRAAASKPLSAERARQLALELGA